MSYNIFNKNASFQGTTKTEEGEIVSGTIEYMVDTHSNQTINGQKTFMTAITSSADVMLSGSGKVSASFFYGDGTNISGVSVSPGGPDRAVQFNNSSATDGSEKLTFLSTPEYTLKVLGTITASLNISASGFYGDGSNLTNVGAATSMLASGLIGSVSASQISSSNGLGASGDNLVIQLQSNSGLVADTNGLKIDLTSLTPVSWTDTDYLLVSSSAAGNQKIQLSTVESSINVNATNIDAGTLNNARLPSIISQTAISGTTVVSGAFFEGDGSRLTGVTSTPAPAGANTQLQFNDDAAFAGDADLTFLTGSNTLATSNVSASVNLSGSSLWLQDEIYVGGQAFLDIETNVAANNASFAEITASSEISSSADVYGLNFRGNGSTLNNVPLGTYANSNIVFCDSTANTITSNSSLQWTGTQLTSTGLSASADVQVGGHITGSGDIVLFGDISGSGNISGSAFYGDGSNLTGVTAGANTQIQFNADDVLGASSKFTFSTSSATLEIAKSDTSTNSAMIWFHSGSDVFGAGNGSFIESDNNNDFIFDINKVDRDIKFITRADSGSPSNKYVKLVIGGTSPGKGVAIGSSTGWGTQDLYVSNANLTADTNIKLANRDNYDVVLSMSSSNSQTTLENNKFGEAFTIKHSAEDTLQATMRFAESSTTLNTFNGGISLASAQYLDLSANGGISLTSAQYLNLSASSTIAITGSTNVVAKFDSSDNYLFTARKLYYKEVSFQLATSLSGGDIIWIPMFGSGVDSTTQVYYMKFIAPFDGEVKNVLMRADLAAGTGDYIIGFHKASNGTSDPNAAPTETENINLDGTANTTRTATFASSTFTKGDVLGFSLTLPSPWSPGANIGVNATIVLAYDELT
jgi:hypothetical protein